MMLMVYFVYIHIMQMLYNRTLLATASFNVKLLLTCSVTSTGFCRAEESASSRMKRTVLQMRRTMKMMGMRVSFTSAIEEKAWDGGLLARMGRYSERATCCVGESTYC